MQQEKVDVLIIGAGPSACVAAAYLHQQALKVKVIEKSKFPRFVIGESLLPRCMEHFEEVGLLACLKARNYEKKYGARFIKNGQTCFFDFSQKYTDGWDWTWQMPRADFDHTLTQTLLKRGVDIVFEWSVEAVQFEGTKSTTLIRSKTGEEQLIEADFVIDASGYGRVLPRLLGLEKPSKMPKNSSIFTHVKDLNRPKGIEGNLLSFDVVKTDLWLWVIPFSNEITSIGFVGSTEFMDQYGEDTEEALSNLLKLSNHYRERFDGIEYEFKPYKLKNQACAVKQLYGDGYALTGNSAEFLDPIFSSGVTFGTESGLLAAKLACRTLRGQAVDWEKEYVEYIESGVNVFSTYIKEWYTGNLQKLFFYDDIDDEIKAKICAVLAGYVWDDSNSFVKKHDRVIPALAHMIDMQKL